jgi:predicted tellurium resistance membrane protein TerC
MFDIFLSPDAWVALLTLTFLEIVLGIDNIIFISIAAGKLEEKDRVKATNIGLVLAMLLRVGLLFGISLLTALNQPFLEIDTKWVQGNISGQAIILFLGGLFLLYKSTKEIHEKIEDKEHDAKAVASGQSKSLRAAIVQITVINIVFSFDSILTAIGMTNGISENPTDSLILMIVAVVISVLIMMLFANPVGEFVTNNPTIQILGLSFLILIGFMLTTEAAHLSELVIFGQSIGSIPKGYLYFSITFSLVVEFLNMNIRKEK